MNCPKCSSSNVQSLEVVFKNSILNANTHRNDSDLELAGVGISKGIAITHSKSAFAAVPELEVAPPVKKKVLWFAMMVLIGTMFIVDHHFSLFFIVGGALLALLGCFFIFKNFIFNMEKYPNLYQKWFSSSMCHQCGSIFDTEK